MSATITNPSQATQADTAADPLLSVQNMKTYFPVKRGLLRRTVGHVKAVDGVSFDIAPRETLGLVGESGCGKSTVGRSILRLVPATSGQVLFDGRDVYDANRSQMKSLRRQMQIIFQDPVGSLNPRMSVGKMIAEPMQVHRLVRGKELRDQVEKLLVRVGLKAEHADRYPHEFSGGQRQRIGIARALALNPRFIVCDEPVSALDVSIQSQILNLLDDLQDEFGLSYLFIAHNLAVVEHFCDRVAVMYLGRIVEMADRDTLYRNPMHPYTKALLSAAPVPEPARQKQRIMLTGEVPSPISYFADEAHGEELSTQGIETEELAGEGDITYVSRESLLDRPPMQPVPGEPGHWVSTRRELS
jgi:ABC-type oligopeptide transport system ATPase subunit